MRVFDGHEDFDLFLKMFGAPSEMTAVSEQKIAEYAESLPAPIINIWRRAGFGRFGNGLVATVDPGRWQAAVDEWIAGTVLEQYGQFFPIVQTAFGAFRLWNRKLGRGVEIVPAFNSIRVSSFETVREEDIDFEAAILWSIFQVRAVDAYRAEDEPSIFEEAVRRLGQLEEGQIFGFEPALVLGGERRVENLRKVNADVHLSMLRQFGEPEIVCFDVAGTLAKVGIDIDDLK